MDWKRNIYNSFVAQVEADREAISRCMESVTLVDGSLLNMMSLGDGTPIVLLPMISELNFLYAPQIQEFSTDYRVITYEPRLSRQQHVGIADRASELLLLMNSLNLTAAHVVAWSDAGAAAYDFAKKWPERCRSVVFLGLPDRYKLPQPIQFLMRLLRKFPLERITPAWLLAYILAGYMRGPLVKRAWVMEYATQIIQLPQLFKHSCLPNMLEHQPRFGEIKIPSLVVCGDSDPVVSRSQAIKMASLLPTTSGAIIIPQGEHMLGYVNASDVNFVLRRFFLNCDK